MYSAIRWLWTGDPPGELIFKQMALRLGWLKAESICFLAFLKLTPVSPEMLPERVMREWSHFSRSGRCSSFVQQGCAVCGIIMNNV